MSDFADASKKRASAEHIARELERQIHSGEIVSGALLPTERELQTSFDASRSTVRKALSILHTHGAVQIIPNRGAVAGRAAQPSPATSTLAFIDGDTYVLRNLFRRMSTQLREMGFHLVHFDTQTQPVEDSLEYAAEQNFAGAFVWPFEGFPDKARIKAAARQVPIITLAHRLRGIDSDLISFDHLAIGRTAAHHLYSQGRRRIAVTGMMDMLPENQDKLAGVMKAAFEWGVQPSASDYVFCSTSGQSKNDTRLLRFRLSQADRPDAVIVFQDDYIPAVIEAIHSCRLGVPEDVALVSIGDDMDVTVGDKSLTAIAHDWESFAVLAIRALTQRLRNPQALCQTLYAAHTLNIRGLCGAPKPIWTTGPGQGASLYQAIESQNPKMSLRILNSSNGHDAGGPLKAEALT